MLLYGAMNDYNIMLGKVGKVSFIFSWYSYLNMYNCNVIGVLLQYAYFETTTTNVQ